MSNHLSVPQTPKVLSNHSTKNSFSFGLGFSPSFPFSSPNNLSIFNSFSPQRFLLNHDSLTSNPLSIQKNLLDLQNFTPPDSQIRRKIFNTNDKDKIEHEDIFEMFPDLNDCKKDTTLTSIHEEKENEDGQINQETSYISQNGTTLISPSMMHKTNIDDTPSIIKTEPDLSREILSDKTNQILNQSNDLGESERYNESVEEEENGNEHDVNEQDNENNYSYDFTDNDDKVLKRRKLSNATGMSTGRSYSISSLTPTGEKVWTDQLDVLLIDSLKQVRYLKSKRPKEKIAQNQIISQLIFEKTGVLRTSKQIASRINYLNKRKINPKNIARPNDSALTTPSNHDMNNFSPLDDLENLINTPIGLTNTPYNHHSGINTKDYDSLDKTIQSLLSSSPMANFKSPQQKIFQANINYELKPEDFKIQFQYNDGENFIFTKMDENSISLSNENGKDNLKSLNDHLDLNSNKLLFKDLSDSNNLNLNKISNLFIINSKISSLNESINLINGKIDSFLKVNVKSLQSSNKCLLNWKCATRVYDDNKLIVNLCESINGFRNYNTDVSPTCQDSNFTLQIPFLSSFWSGYLSFISNGGNSSLKNLSMIQFIYEGEENNTLNPGLSGVIENKGKIHGCLIYNFDICDDSESKTTFTKINLNYGNKNYSSIKKHSNIEDSPCDKDVILKSDDNTVDIDDDETVAASPRMNNLNSSPFIERSAYQKHKRTTSNAQNLKIEIPENTINNTLGNDNGNSNNLHAVNHHPFLNPANVYPNLQPFQQNLQRQYLMNMNPQQQQVLNNSYLLQQQMLQSGPPSAPLPMNQANFDVNFFNNQQKLLMMNPNYQSFIQRQYQRQHQLQMQHQHQQIQFSMNNGLRSAPVTQTKFFEDKQYGGKLNFKPIIEYKPNDSKIDIGDVRRSMSNGDIQFQFYKPS